MSYHVRRIDPYWLTHPLITAAVVGGAALGSAGVVGQRASLAWTGVGLVAVGVLLAAKPVVSAVLGTLGVAGGLLQFVVLPNRETYGWPMFQKLGSGVIFGLLYMIVMDSFVLAVAVLYNFFGALAGGVKLDIEESDAE